MAFTKAEILDEVTSRTGRTDIDQTALDKLLKAVLFELSTKWPFLTKSSSAVIGAGGKSVAVPTGTRNIISVVDASNNILGRIPSWNVYLALVKENSANSTPTRWIVFNDTLYVHPGWTAGGTLTVYHSYYTNAVDAIVFPDHFKEAVIEGTCFKAFESKGEGADPAKGGVHKALYDGQIADLVRRYTALRNSPEEVEVMAG